MCPTERLPVRKTAQVGAMGVTGAHKRSRIQKEIFFIFWLGGLIMIEVTTKYTKESYLKFHWFHIARSGVRKVVYIAMLAFLFCAGAALLMYMFIADFDNQPSIFFLSFLSLSLPLYCIIFPYINASIAFKKSPVLFDMGLTFTFHEDYFTAQSTGMVSSISNIRYEALYRVYQTRDSFYLYLQQRQSYIIDKTHFTVGKPEDLAALLEKAISAKKYRSYI